MAKKLLVTTTLSITEISGRAGFGSQSYFGDYFRRITGVSPRQYRINGNEKTENKRALYREFLSKQLSGTVLFVLLKMFILL